MIDETGEEPGAGAARAFRHYDLAMAALVAILLLSNVIGAGKVATVRLPLLGGWNNEAVFGHVPRVVLAGVCAFWAGEFVNAFVLARMKLWTRGRHLWARTIGRRSSGRASTA